MAVGSLKRTVTVRCRGLRFFNGVSRDSYRLEDNHAGYSRPDSHSNGSSDYCDILQAGHKRRFLPKGQVYVSDCTVALRKSRAICLFRFAPLPAMCARTHSSDGVYKPTARQLVTITTEWVCSASRDG
jgi:hypothetical protein